MILTVDSSHVTPNNSLLRLPLNLRGSTLPTYSNITSFNPDTFLIPPSLTPPPNGIRITPFYPPLNLRGGNLEGGGDIFII
jgi:hypothetical protein